ncbi:hypothetical protein M427DRAFT_379070 [Gonapodya prolifera JEL478]|uniref:Uncharacterized protein n=1 Tax=Gonapodya prolifera (strain JEL478) TaxID=1344416 RepID=A0A139AV62_GONPJ|nr:hypothetical protein M427DRAFT_379070 [Gonapodya prolifera JEL478]|eukprot:KXS20597.1 hypothetical protein M427DRAFT_379070 [Gonapodya prolifera JEL478]
MNCGGPKGFNITVFMKSPGLQLDFAKVGAVAGTSMFENISLGVDKIFKDFTGDVTAVFPSTTIIQTLSLFILFYEDDRPTNYRSHVSYFHGFSSYESSYKNLLAASSDAQFLTDEFKNNQSGVFKFGVRDAVRRVTLDRQDLRRSVEADVEAYLGSQEMPKRQHSERSFDVVYSCVLTVDRYKETVMFVQRAF